MKLKDIEFDKAIESSITTRIWGASGPTTFTIEFGDLMIPREDWILFPQKFKEKVTKAIFPNSIYGKGLRDVLKRYRDGESSYKEFIESLDDVRIT